MPETNKKETAMFDRRIGRIGGFVVGMAMVVSALVMAMNRKSEHARTVAGADARGSYQTYQERAKATERLLVEDRLDLSGF
jgi:hypothetical protein